MRAYHEIVFNLLPARDEARLQVPADLHRTHILLPPTGARSPLPRPLAEANSAPSPPLPHSGASGREEAKGPPLARTEDLKRDGFHPFFISSENTDDRLGPLSLEAKQLLKCSRLILQPKPASRMP